MENLLLVYMIAFTILLGIVVLQARRSDETRERRFARIRVPVDDRRRAAAHEPPEDEVEPVSPMQVWLLTTLVVLVLLLLGNAL